MNLRKRWRYLSASAQTGTECVSRSNGARGRRTLDRRVDGPARRDEVWPDSDRATLCTDESASVPIDVRGLVTGKRGLKLATVSVGCPLRGDGTRFMDAMTDDALCLDRNSHLTATDVPHPCPRGDAPHMRDLFPRSKSLAGLGDSRGCTRRWRHPCQLA